MNDYAPAVLETEARRYPAFNLISTILGGVVKVVPVPIPLHCKDGFNEADYGRAERLLDERARLACSAWSFIHHQTSSGYLDHLRRDLKDGTWDAHHKHLRTQASYDGSLQLLIAAQ